MPKPAGRRSGLHHLFLFWRVDNILNGRTILHRLIHNGWWSILHIFHVLLFYLCHCNKPIILSNTSNKVLMMRHFTACFSVLVQYVLTVHFVKLLDCHHLFELGFVSTNSSGVLPCIRRVSRNELIFDVSISLHHRQRFVGNPLISCMIKSWCSWLDGCSSLSIPGHRECSISLSKPFLISLHVWLLSTVTSWNCERRLHHFLHGRSWRVMNRARRVVIHHPIIRLPDVDPFESWLGRVVQISVDATWWLLQLHHITFIIN